MRHKRWRLSESYQWVKDRRPSINITTGTLIVVVCYSCPDTPYLYDFSRMIGIVHLPFCCSTAFEYLFGWDLNIIFPYLHADWFTSTYRAFLGSALLVEGVHSSSCSCIIALHSSPSTIVSLFESLCWVCSRRSATAGIWGGGVRKFCDACAAAKHAEWSGVWIWVSKSCPGRQRGSSSIQFFPDLERHKPYTFSIRFRKQSTWAQQFCIRSRQTGPTREQQSCYGPEHGQFLIVLLPFCNCLILVQRATCSVGMILQNLPWNRVTVGSLLCSFIWGGTVWSERERGVLIADRVLVQRLGININRMHECDVREP